MSTHKTSKRVIATRVVCAILALLMVGSIAYSAIYFIMNM